MRLLFSNCYLYNKNEKSLVYRAGRQLHDVFEYRYSKLPGIYTAMDQHDQHLIEEARRAAAIQHLAPAVQPTPSPSPPLQQPLQPPQTIKSEPEVTPQQLAALKKLEARHSRLRQEKMHIQKQLRDIINGIQAQVSPVYWFFLVQK